MKSSADGKNRTGIIFLLIFLGLAAGILAGGYFAYQNYEQNFRAEAERQLSAIAELKATQLVQYRTERLGDASTFFKNPAFSSLVKQFFEQKNDGKAQRQLQTWLTRLQSFYSYEGLVLLDTRGIVRMSVPEKTVPTASMIRNKISEVLRSGMVVMQDFHRNEHDQKIYLTILVPIMDDTHPNRQMGVLLLRIDPEVYLYPFIQAWPVLSRTSETLIVRRDGNDVLFLNELRFQKNTALNLRIPLSNDTVAAVKAVLGQKGIVDALDYRGEPITADVRKVPDSPWFMVCRIDKAEIYEPLRSRLWMTLILVGAFMSAAGAGVGLVWRHQRNSFYREQFKMAEVLRASEVKFRQTFDLSPTGIVMVGLDKRFHRINDAFSHFLGYSVEELAGKTIEDITFAEDRNIGMAEMMAIVKGEINTSRVQKRYVRKDGEWVWGEVTISLVRDQENRPQYFLSIIEDITEQKRNEAELHRLYETSEHSRLDLLSILEDQKRVEEALRDSQSLYHSFIEQLPNAVFRKDREGRYVLVNPEFCRLKNLKKEDFIGKKPVEVAASATNAQGIEGPATKYAHVGEDVHEQILRSGKTFETEEEYHGTVGGILHMYVMRMPVFDSRGTIVGTQGIMFDISERKRAEREIQKLNQELESRVWQRTAELTESEERFRQLAEASYEAIIIHESGVLLRANDQFSKLFGFELGELLGKQVMPLTTAPQSLEVLKKQIDTGGLGPYEATGRRKDGTTFPMEVRARIIEYKGRPVRVAAIMDITRRKQAEEALRERTVALEAANKELEAFSYSVSHDLRAPLRSIDGFSQALLEDYHDKLDENGKSHLTRVRNAAQRMAQLIDDVLDLSRIHRVEMSRVSVDLTGLAKEIIEDLRETQPRKNVEVAIEPGMSAVGDTQLLRLFLQNLLENAWKFTSKHNHAKIEIGSRESDGKKVFYVKDDGAGFDMAHADMLFAPFQRLHAQTEFPGTGVGLASAQRIIHRHGGTIWAESEVEKGATFYFTL